MLALAIGVTHWGGDLLALLPVAGVWVAVQAIEGAVLSPRLLGREVGLHPVWVLFAVFAGGELAGLTGVFLAVPIAAVVSVLVRHFYRYLSQGRQPIAAEEEDAAEQEPAA
ncbi:MAG: AI-2E family transporter [Alphaproteobacteria bacterium]|nr:MAG: AI-2E family transporter [Alphaproteobacteria bacterium]